jgi:hypothetical protein
LAAFEGAERLLEYRAWNDESALRLHRFRLLIQVEAGAHGGAALLLAFVFGLLLRRLPDALHRVRQRFQSLSFLRLRRDRRGQLGRLSD